MDVGARLTYYVEKQGFTKKSFCEAYSFEYNSMVMIMADKRSIGTKVLNQLHVALPNLNTHWLLYGDGPIEVFNVYEENLLEEPGAEYIRNKDPFEAVLLKYLEKPTVKNKIYEIAKTNNEQK